MKDCVNLVVTCTKDKRAPIDPACRVRDLPAGPIEMRMEQWADRMRDRQFHRVAVKDLYAGDHWSVVRSIESNYFAINTWVCSAGHGLVQLSDRVTPYSATFSGNHPDTVIGPACNDLPGEVRNQWWQLLAKKVRAGRSTPRTLTSLAANDPKAALIVVASGVYLEAVEADLQKARQELADPNLLSIISAGGRLSNGLASHLVPCDARFQHTVGGARRSLNTRVARHSLCTAKTLPTLPKLKRRLQAMLEEQPELVKYERKTMSDDDVMEYIAGELSRNPKLKASPLLRKLRDSGRACEQKRFGRLYKRVAGAPGGIT